jgi:hypothetical protein
MASTINGAPTFCSLSILSSPSLCLLRIRSLVVLSFNQDYLLFFSLSPSFLYPLVLLSIMRLGSSRTLSIALLSCSIAFTKAVVIKRDGSLSGTALPVTSTNTPSNGALPPDVGTGGGLDFQNLTCTGDITDLGKNPVNRWKAALADEALTRVNRNWNENPDAGGSEVSLTYVNAMMNLFGKGEQNCGLEIDSCDFSSLGCTDVDNPGDWLVMKSLSNFHKVYR